MAKGKVLRGNIFLKEFSPSAGEANRILTYNVSTGEVTYKTAVDTSTFVSTTLPSAQVLVGNGSNVATAVAMTGDVTISNTGVTAISAGVITNNDINASAGITYGKLSLTGGIVNNDISGSAAIAYSKLNLSASIVNADVAAAAGIARSKTASGTAYRILANTSGGVMGENAALTAARAIVSDANGQLVAATPTTTEVNRLSGVTANIQTQLDTKITGKATNALVQSPTASEDGFAITWDDGAQEWALTDPVIQGIPVAGSTSQVLMKDSGTDYDASWTSLLTTHITDITATAAELNILDGATLTVTELNYVDGVTSNIQTQLDAKQSSSLAQNAIWVGNASNIATQLSPGTNGYVLTMSGGAPQWQPASGSQHIIENAGTPLTARANLNFRNGLSAADNSPDTDAKWGGALIENTEITGAAFTLKLGTSGSKIGAFEINSSSTVTIVSDGVTNISTSTGNLVLGSGSDEVILGPQTQIRINNSVPSFGGGDCSYMYSTDISASGELFAVNEAGVETQISTNIVSAPSTSIGATIVNYYGSSATNFLGDPVAWMVKKIGATTYKIPLY